MMMEGVVASFSFKNDRLGIGEFVDRLQAFRDVRVAVESSGNFWVKLYEAQRLPTFYGLVWLLKPQAHECSKP
jgi:hypothetical protein